MRKTVARRATSIIPVERLERAIAGITTPRTARDLDAWLAGLAVAVKKQGALVSEQNTVTLYRLLAQAAGGRLLAQVPRAPASGGPKRKGQGLRPSLDATGLSRAEADRWEVLGRKSDAEIRVWVTAALEQIVMDAAYGWANGAHVAYNAGDDEWYTPQPYITAARAVLGELDLDPASTQEANTVVGAARFYTTEQNGLLQEWRGRVWLNPPYASELVGLFMSKLVACYTGGDVVAAITLTNNATETDWFVATSRQAAALCLPDGRIKFWHPRKQATPLQGQALLYLGENPRAFLSGFASFGPVWIRP